MADDGVEDGVGGGGSGHAPIVAEELPDLIQEQRARPGMVKRIALLAAALVLFGLGIVGWLVPIVTGIPFYILAAVCAGMASPRVARWINRHERRLPRRWRLLLRPRLRRSLRRPGTRPRS